MPRRHVSVLVGTDLEGASVSAVERATQIARLQRAVLHLVHATRPLPRRLARAFGDGATGDGHERIALARVVAQARADGVAANAHLLEGGAASALRKKARDLRVDLVVVGSRGRTVADAVLGSTAERVATSKGPPVLLAREARARPYRSVVVGVSVDTNVERAVHFGRFVAGGAELSLVHAYESPFEGMLFRRGVSAAEVRRYRAGVREDARASLAGTIAEAGVDATALELLLGDRRVVLARAAKAGTLLVIDRGGGALRRALLGSVSRWVIEHSASDVLLV